MSEDKKDQNVHQRRVEQEEKPLKGEQEEEQVEENKYKANGEKSKDSTEHIYLHPKIQGHKYNEFPTLSIFLHITLIFLFIILYFVDTNTKPLKWICLFFYLGIQAESLVGDIPLIFKINNTVKDISLLLKNWHEKWITFTYDVSTYHYQSRNVHGQKRRGKVYSSFKDIKLDYLTCEDVSQDSSTIFTKNDIFIITREVIYSYGNEKVQQEFETKIKEAVEEGQKKDKFVESNMIIKLKDIESDPIQWVYKKKSSIFINKFFFWLSSLLLLTIPYRLFVNSHTAHLDYKIHKRIYA